MPAPTLLLAIETSNPSAWAHACRERPGVCIARVAGSTPDILGTRDIDPGVRHDDHLLPLIDDLTRSLALRPRDLGAVAVSCGPGGFTAVRLAVTTAKLVAEATGALCVPVPSAHVAAWAFDAREPFAVALASKGDDAYVTVLGPGRDEQRAGELLDAAGFVRAVSTHGVRALLADRFLPDLMRRAAADAGVRMEQIELGPAACARAAVRRGLERSAVDPAALLPIYPREPEAVTKWRRMHAG